MIKDIVKDQFFLQQKSIDATKEDSQIIQDLKDTLHIHQHECVGIAANMIGYHKRIMIVNDEGKDLILINPKMIKQEGLYHCEEGCLSLQGMRTTKRYKKIKVDYLDENFKKKVKTFYDYTAQIIQHEYDHFEGIII